MKEGLAAIVGLAKMVPIIRAQQQADLAVVFVSPADHPLCGWPGCQHRTTRDHGDGSQPRYECEPHAQFGNAYEAVRVQTGTAFGASGVLAGLASFLSKDEGTRTKGRALLIEGARSIVASATKPRKG